jgi:NitT/TauT family transport system ATP-binding protein
VINFTPCKLSTIEAQEITNVGRKTILKLENVSKIYHGNSSDKNNRVLLKHVVLNNLNLDVREGEFITIVGPSGCGKSTLLNIVSGIDRSYIGEIRIDGKPISQSTNTDRIVIFQEGALFPWLTVYENVEFGLKVAKLPKNNRRDIVMHYIGLVQLTNFANAFVHQLSGGMKQRVAVARALALNPKILLMDEPFAALDIQTRRMLYNQLLQIHQETNKTILFVTHNINEAVALGDRVIVMSPRLANINKEFIVDLPRPRQLDHLLINSITKEIIEESRELYYSSSSSYPPSVSADNTDTSKSEFEIASNILST